MWQVIVKNIWFQNAEPFTCFLRSIMKNFLFLIFVCFRGLSVGNDD